MKTGKTLQTGWYSPRRVKLLIDYILVLLLLLHTIIFLQFDANKFYSFIHTRGFVYLLGNFSQQTTTHVQNKSTLIFCWTHHYQVPMIKLFSVCTVQYRTFLRYFTYRKEWWNNENPTCYDFTRKGRPRELL